MKPHRGILILILGILSLVVCGLFAGIPAWIMGSRDLKEMDAGIMDPEGRGITTAGKICGMISCIMTIIAIAVAIFVTMFVAYFAYDADPTREDIEWESPSSVNEYEPALESSSSVDEAHSLRVVTVGRIDKLIIIDEGRGSRIYEYKDLAKGWEQELSFKGSFRLWCSWLENLRFSVDDGPEKLISGEGSGSFSLKPNP